MVLGQPGGHSQARGATAHDEEVEILFGEVLGRDLSGLHGQLAASSAAMRKIRSVSAV